MKKNGFKKPKIENVFSTTVDDNFIRHGAIIDKFK